MNRQLYESNRVVLTSEQIERYIAHARQVRNEVLMRGLKQAGSRLWSGFRRTLAGLSDVLHSIGGKESGAQRPC